MILSRPASTERQSSDCIRWDLHRQSARQSCAVIVAEKHATSELIRVTANVRVGWQFDVCQMLRTRLPTQNEKDPVEPAGGQPSAENMVDIYVANQVRAHGFHSESENLASHVSGDVRHVRAVHWNECVLDRVDDDRYG